MTSLHLGDPFVKDVIGRYVTRNAVAQPNRKATNRVVVHHAAWTYVPGTACRSIFQYHSSQWPKYGRIGYHEVIQEEPDNSLVCYLVNPPDLIGAGVWGQNEDCFHICAATHFKNTIPAQVWQDALALRVAAAKKRYPKATIVGHKEITKPGHETTCPGTRWAEWKPDLLAKVEELARPLHGSYKVLGVPIFEGPGFDFPIALGGTAFLSSGDEVVIDEVKPEWGGFGHLGSKVGFVFLKQLRRL